MTKEYRQLDFTDNFMFCKVIANNPELCRHMLELILGKKIKKVSIKTAEKTIDVTPQAKSIRMDVYLDDDAGTVYDLEMQTTKERNLPKRLRYYQGMVDLNLIQKGEDYDDLPETVILFICTFDFFKKGLPFYVFENRCEAMPELLLGDGAKKVFVNPDGSRESLSREAAGLLDYIRDGKPTDEFTSELEQEVKKARTHKDWEVEYMQWRAYEMDVNSDKKRARKEGYDQGLLYGKIQIYMQEMHLSVEEVAKKLSVDTKTVEKILAEMK
jgi:predicted transposase/invertase (TIGR01784 family)